MAPSKRKRAESEKNSTKLGKHSNSKQQSRFVQGTSKRCESSEPHLTRRQARLLGKEPAVGEEEPERLLKRHKPRRHQRLSVENRAKAVMNHSHEDGPSRVSLYFTFQTKRGNSLSSSLVLFLSLFSLSLFLGWVELEDAT